MIAYALRRLGFYLLAAWVAVSLNFAIPRLMPGDPAAVIFGRFQGRLAPEALDALKAAFGLTEAPLLSQYVTYLRHLLSGDLGLSVAYFPSPVAEVIGTGLGWTVLLAGLSVVAEPSRRKATLRIPAGLAALHAAAIGHI